MIRLINEERFRFLSKTNFLTKRTENSLLGSGNETKISERKKFGEQEIRREKIPGRSKKSF